MHALDCCAGAGGLSLGLHYAGFDVRGVELDAAAVETHRAQVGPCDHASLWDYVPGRSYEIVAGGIPCQSHSTAGKRAGTCDPRGQLYVPFLRIAQQARAHAVLIENVRGMLTSPSKTHRTAFREVVAAVRYAGFFHVKHAVLDAADYGVPQHRRRLFIVAFADAFHADRFKWPSPTHSEGGTGGLLPWVTVRQALKLGEDSYEHGLMPTAKGTTRQGFRKLNADAPAPTVTSNTWHQGESAARPSQRKWGQLQRAMSVLDEPAATVTGTCGAIAAFASSEYRSRIAAGLAAAGVLDRPATTVDTRNALSAAGHHDSNKRGAVRLSIEQLAALQAFPEEFVFTGTKTQRHRQVGNAVPPPLAAAVASSVRAVLDARASRRVA